jgi:hypothetical protein
VKKRNAFIILVGKHQGNKPCGRHNLDGTIILKWILKKNVVGWVSSNSG